MHTRLANLSRWMEIDGRRCHFGLRIARNLLPTNPAKIWHRYCGFYLARGSLSFLDADGQQYQLVAGSFGQHLPGRFHDLRRQPDIPCEEWSMMADQEVFALSQRLGLIETQAPVCLPGPSAEQVWHRTWSVIADAKTSNAHALLAWLDLIQAMRQNPQGTAQPNKTETTLQQAADDLASDLKASLDLSDLAQDLGWSYAHFRRCFKQHYGLAPPMPGVRGNVCVTPDNYSVSRDSQ